MKFYVSSDVSHTHTHHENIQNITETADFIEAADACMSISKAWNTFWLWLQRRHWLGNVCADVIRVCVCWIREKRCKFCSRALAVEAWTVAFVEGIITTSCWWRLKLLDIQFMSCRELPPPNRNFLGRRQLLGSCERSCSGWCRMAPAGDRSGCEELLRT